MKLRWLVVATMCIVVGPCVDAAATNILSNGSFDVKGSGIPGWAVSVGTTRYGLVSDPGRSGRVIEGVEAAPGGSLGRLIQYIDGRFVPGETYRLTGWIKANGVSSPEGAVIGVGTVDAQGALAPGSFMVELGRVSGTSDWTFYDSGAFTLPPLTPGTVAHAVYLDINGNGGGIARFDDIALIGRAVPPPPIASATGPSPAGIGALLLMAVLSFSALWSFGRYRAQVEA